MDIHPRDRDSSLIYDVTIIGGGLAGSVLATLLSNEKMSVALVEPRNVYPECFKAEKLEPDQWQLLEKHGLLNLVLPVCERIDAVQLASAGNIHGAVSITQYGYLYHNLVNAVGSQLQNKLSVFRCKAVGIEVSDDVQTVSLSHHPEIRSRLVVVATGRFGKIHSQLGLVKKMISRQHSFNFGFNIDNPSRPLSFDSLTYHASEMRSGVDYVTLFKVPNAMRGNLFTYWKPNSEHIRSFSSKPKDTILHWMAGLRQVLGDFEIEPKIDRFSIDLYVAENLQCPGVVFIGDAFQSVCPATGTGLSKIFTDVDVLFQYVMNEWMVTPGMSAKKIASFYQDPRKQEQDRHSLNAAIRRRRVAVEISDLRFKTAQFRHKLKMRKNCRRSEKLIGAVAN